MGARLEDFPRLAATLFANQDSPFKALATAKKRAERLGFRLADGEHREAHTTIEKVRLDPTPEALLTALRRVLSHGPLPASQVSVKAAWAEALLQDAPEGFEVKWGEVRYGRLDLALELLLDLRRREIPVFLGWLVPYLDALLEARSPDGDRRTALEAARRAKEQAGSLAGVSGRRAVPGAAAGPPAGALQGGGG